MQTQSPFVLMQRAEVHIKGLLRTLDTDMLDKDERKLMSSLKRLAIDARLDIRDYELSETRPEQVENAVKAKNIVFKLQAAILATGNVFGPADVAHLSAQLEQINGKLE